MSLTITRSGRTVTAARSGGRAAPHRAAAVAALSLLALAPAAVLAQQDSKPVFDGPNVYRVRVDIVYPQSTCEDGRGPTSYRQTLEGVVGPEGSFYHVSESSITGEPLSGAVKRRVTKSDCGARCPDGSCEAYCTTTAEATGVSVVGFHPTDEGVVKLKIQHPRKLADAVTVSGDCREPAVTKDELYLFEEWSILDLPGLAKLRPGSTYKLELFGYEEAGIDARLTVMPKEPDNKQPRVRRGGSKPE